MVTIATSLNHRTKLQPNKLNPLEAETFNPLYRPLMLAADIVMAKLKSVVLTSRVCLWDIEGTDAPRIIASHPPQGLSPVAGHAFSVQLQLRSSTAVATHR